MTQAVEVNFDGLVGPTHNYSGLSIGNQASMSHGGQASNPRKAALQGLAKMRALLKRGLTQSLLPPHERPHAKTLRQLGFTGSLSYMTQVAYQQSPALLANVMSASPMWTANAATVSPSADTKDGRVHFTSANLASTFHRSIEHEQTTRTLKRIFADEQHFQVHDAIDLGAFMGDEGAANHGRFATAHGHQGVELFVYGRTAFDKSTAKYPRRQALESFQAVARQHGLNQSQCIFAQQNSEAIDAGAFHNDVVSVTNGNTFFLHEQTFENQAEVKAQIQATCDFDIHFVEVPKAQVSLNDVIQTYLFNSQLLTMPEGHMALLLPTEVKEQTNTREQVEQVIAANNPIQEAIYMDLRESMHNGGGPACLRLRAVLTEKERQALSGNMLLNDETLNQLERLVNTHYRDGLVPKDLADPQLIIESHTALDEITQLLELGSIYDFQQA